LRANERESGNEVVHENRRNSCRIAAASAHHFDCSGCTDGKCGLSLRVPLEIVSIIDFVAQLKKPAAVHQINQALKKASQDTVNLQI